jgi:hypothetical protein
VNRLFGRNVMKSDCVVTLGNLIARNFAGNNFAENTVSQYLAPSPLV